MEIDHTITGCEQSRRDQLLLQENYQNKIRAFRETRIGKERDMEELQKSHVLKVEKLSRRKLTEEQNTIMELRARIQELQNEVNCVNDSRDLKDAESVRSGPSHVPSQPALLPPNRDPGKLLSRNNQPPDIQGITGNVFSNPPASSSSPYPGGFNPWISNVTEDTLVLRSTGQPVTCGDCQIPDTVLMGQTNNDCRFQIFISTNSLHQQHLLVGGLDSRLRYVLVHNFLRKLCYGSKKWRRLNQWMISNLRHL